MNKYSPEYLAHIHSKPMNLYTVKKCIKNSTVIEAKVTRCKSDNTLVIDLGKNIIAEVPLDELEYHWDGTPIKPVAASSKLNKHIKIVLKSISKIDNVYIVQASRKEVQKDCFENFIKNLKVGDVIDAYVIRIYGYGIFCDIGCGIPALLPTNNISITHIVNPLKALRDIMSIKVVVSKIDENYKIELSHKELLGTWEEEASNFNEEDVVVGTVLSVEDYGVFIRLSQNLSGLADKTTIELHPGDIVSTRVIAIRPNTMKVKLCVIEKVASDAEKLKFEYNNVPSHIKDWIYSTPNSKKVIKSEFY